MTAPAHELSVGIVGGGVAGLVAAHILQRRHRVTLYEANDDLGGHTHTVTIPDGPDAGTPVDTGFIVLNDRTYPLFQQFLGQLGVPVRPSDMSFSFHCERTGLQYAGTTLNGLFAQRRNLISPGFWLMLRDIARFGRQGLADSLGAHLSYSLTLGAYLERLRLSPRFVHDYLLPMGSAIWSTPAADMLEYPALSFLRFFGNHGLLSLKDRPQWYTVVGGSSSYVRRFQERFTGRVRLATPVRAIRRRPDGITLHLDGGEEVQHDRVVIAAHADQALRMLSDPSPLEQELLGVWRYSRNHVLLHTDSDALPPLRRAWASWNYLREAGAGPSAPVSVTYHMNRLQGLSTREQYCVTLNRSRPIPAANLIREFVYTHPTFTPAALKAQARLPMLNGQRHTYFCGSYFGHGFHEDAVRSAVWVARSMGLDL